MSTDDLNTVPLAGQVFARVWDMDEYESAREYEETVTFYGTHIGEANVTTSMILGGKDTHKVILDIDLPAKLIPSSTPGHFHLYIDKAVPWEDYLDVLRALAKAGIIEQGYLGASEQRGYTSARLPWIKKHQAELLAV